MHKAPAAEAFKDTFALFLNVEIVCAPFLSCRTSVDLNSRYRKLLHYERQLLINWKHLSGGLVNHGYGGGERETEM